MGRHRQATHLTADTSEDLRDYLTRAGVGGGAGGQVVAGDVSVMRRELNRGRTARQAAATVRRLNVPRRRGRQGGNIAARNPRAGGYYGPNTTSFR